MLNYDWGRPRSASARRDAAPYVHGVGSLCGSLPFRPGSVWDNWAYINRLPPGEGPLTERTAGVRRWWRGPYKMPFRDLAAALACRLGRVERAIGAALQLRHGMDAGADVNG